MNFNIFSSYFSCTGSVVMAKSTHHYNTWVMVPFINIQLCSQWITWLTQRSVWTSHIMHTSLQALFKHNFTGYISSFCIFPGFILCLPNRCCQLRWRMDSFDTKSICSKDNCTYLCSSICTSVLYDYRETLWTDKGMVSNHRGKNHTRQTNMDKACNWNFCGVKVHILSLLADTRLTWSIP